MQRERANQGDESNGPVMRGHAPERAAPQALGDVARDVIDHLSMIVRDWLKIGQLEARRWVEHVRRDVARRAALAAASVITGSLAALFGLVALFLGIAQALGSVAWAFAIYCALFAVIALIAGFAARAQPPDEAAAIAARFPAPRPNEAPPALLSQTSSPDAHHEHAEPRASGGVEPRAPASGASG